MTRPKIAFSVLLSLLVIAGIFWALEVTNVTHFLHKSNTQDVPPAVTNATPATNTDRADTETLKTDQPSNDTAGQTSNGSGQTNTTQLKKVGVEITTYSTAGVSVNGFATGVVEDGGTCTLTATAKSDGKVLTATHPGEANATNTTCGMTIIERSKFHSGSWTLVLSYKSATSQGGSDPLELTL